MSENRIVTATYDPSGRSVTEPVYKWNYGNVLKLEEFPEGFLTDVFEVHFSIGSGKSKTAIGTNAAVNIPNICLEKFGTVTAWLFLHDTENDGETRYEIGIPVIARDNLDDEEPTPIEESAITQAIAALNVGVTRAETAQAAAETAQGAAETAQENAEAAADRAEQAAETAAEDAIEAAKPILDGYKNAAESAAASAANSATDANASRSAADVSATAAGVSERNAKASEEAAAGSASDAAGSARTAGTKATQASNYADYASASASSAQASAETATTKAGEASQSASDASGYAAAAETAQGKAEIAQGKAEDAQEAAEAAQAAAETAESNAEASKAAAAASATAAAGSATAAAGSASAASDVKDYLDENYASLSADVSNLNSAFNNLDIEGFEKSEYIDLIASGEATLHDNAYVEYSGNSVVITASSAYHYYSVAVSEGEIYKATGLARWSIRPIMFANANGDRIGMAPSSPSSESPYTVTVEATVPAGATVMYTTANKNGQIEVFRKQTTYTSDYESRISELENDVDTYDGIVIEGFEKENWVSLLGEATYHANAYIEKAGTDISVSSNSNYYYYECDVTEGKKYKSTAISFFDIRHIYANDDGKVLAIYPEERVTTATQVTLESIAPIGATKLYLSNTTARSIEFYTEGIYYKSSEENSTQISVVVNVSATEDTVVSSVVNGKTVKNGFQVFNTTGQPNRAVLPASCSYDDKYLMHNEDDNCPVGLSSGYIGAGHGYSRAFKLTLSGHGKTYADIGSKWINDSQYIRYYYIVRIIDENNLVALGNNVSENEYDTTGWVGGETLTHVEGAVHTDTMTGFTRVQYLLTPIDKNHTKKILLDGIIPVSSDGEYKANEFVDIVDEYDIVNPQDIVQQIIANKPSGGYTENPEINTGDTFLHFSNLYRVLADGTMLLFTTIDNSLNITLGYWGGTQYAQKSPANAFGGALFRYVPKVLPIDSHEFRIPFNMANWNFTANATTEYWEDADNPPDRLLHLFTDGNGKYAAGFAVGYLPIAEGLASVRKNNVSNAMYLYNTKKAYFRLVDSGGTNGNSWTAFKPFQCVCYRKPVIDVADVHTDAYFVPCGDKCYLYADYHAAADDRIKVPAKYVGKPMTVVEKSSNITVYGTVATDEIRIRCATADPMYGYAVIQIG